MFFWNAKSLLFNQYIDSWGSFLFPPYGSKALDEKRLGTNKSTRQDTDPFDTELKMISEENATTHTELSDIPHSIKNTLHLSKCLHFCAVI